jgi:PAS domain S-box-containing protein
MYAATALASEVISTAVEAALGGVEALCAAVETLPAPIYVTDAEGVVVYFNEACIGFTGRQPAVGKDQWCVTWKLYTDGGEFLPHAECPMAVAVKERRTVRGVSAVAERPDGTRVSFMPFPTPIHRADGTFAGAVNLLIDITEVRQIEELRSEAGRARRLARAVNDAFAGEALRTMADECEAKAASLRAEFASPFLSLS